MRTTQIAFGCVAVVVLACAGCEAGDRAPLERDRSGVAQKPDGTESTPGYETQPADEIDTPILDPGIDLDRPGVPQSRDWNGDGVIDQQDFPAARDWNGDGAIDSLDVPPTDPRGTTGNLDIPPWRPARATPLTP